MIHKIHDRTLLINMFAIYLPKYDLMGEAENRSMGNKMLTYE